MRGWEWDESLFAGTAPYYLRGRLPYTAGLDEAMAGALDLDGHGRLLDVGCGPGVIALQLARFFESVTGLDPDAGMLAEASWRAREQQVTNVSWARLRAEDLPAGLGAFRVVTFAASFHWMDRATVAAAVATMLDPGGVAVQIDAPAYRPAEMPGEPLPYPAPPHEAIADLRRRYLGPGIRAGQSIRNSSPSGEDAVFQAAGFRPADEFTVPDGRILTRTADDVVAGVFSTSLSAPHLFGDHIGAFENDLRAILTAASPSGRFSVLLPDNILRVWHL